MRRVLALLSIGLASATQAGPPAASIEEFVTAQWPDSGAPGLAYAVVDDGHIQTSVRGVLQMGSDSAVAPDTPFVLGSISKSITAMAVMQLMEAGRLELDAPISRYLTAFSGRPSGVVTIRQLLSHTSGYSTLQGNWDHTDTTEQPDELSTGVERIAQWPLAFAPGTRWEYSNANYQILGALIEAEGGQDYASYIKSKILEPIGMDHSFVADGSNHDAMATGHVPWFGTKLPLAENRTGRVIAPAGGVIASARDVARYMAVMMNGEDDVISAGSKSAMLRPASAASPFYGFGWFLDTAGGTAFHDGSSPGTETLATMMPAHKRGVVVLVNAGSGIGFGETSALRNGISARALGLNDMEEVNSWSQKALFVALALLPLAFVAAMVWSWRHRPQLLAKRTNAFGLFSLWFPLATTLATAGVFFLLVPQLFGVSISTLARFQPDLVLIFVATAATGVLWALLRLGLAYGGGRPT